MENRNNIIVGIIGVLILAAAGYMLFFRGGEEPVLTAEGGSNEAEATFVNLTNQIDPVTFDTSILSDPRFIQLRDIRTAVTPEPAGRTDPFAPLSGLPE